MSYSIANTFAICLQQDSIGEPLEDELGLAGAVADDVESEFVRNVCNNNIVTGNETVTLFTVNP